MLLQPRNRIDFGGGANAFGNASRTSATPGSQGSVIGGQGYLVGYLRPRCNIRLAAAV